MNTQGFHMRRRRTVPVLTVAVAVQIAANSASAHKVHSRDILRFGLQFAAYGAQQRQESQQKQSWQPTPEQRQQYAENRAEQAYQIGTNLVERGLYQASIPYLCQSLAFRPDHAGALCNRAMAYRHLNVLYRALADLNRAIELDPSSGIAFGERAIVQHRLGNDGVALADLKESARLEPAQRGYYDRASGGLLSHEEIRMRERLLASQVETPQPVPSPTPQVIAFAPDQLEALHQPLPVVSPAPEVVSANATASETPAPVSAVATPEPQPTPAKVTEAASPVVSATPDRLPQVASSITDAAPDSYRSATPVVLAILASLLGLFGVWLLLKKLVSLVGELYYRTRIRFQAVRTAIALRQMPGRELSEPSRRAVERAHAKFDLAVVTGLVAEEQVRAHADTAIAHWRGVLNNQLREYGIGEINYGSGELRTSDNARECIAALLAEFRNRISKRRDLPAREKYEIVRDAHQEILQQIKKENK